MNYTYTYDDSPITSRRNHLWWQASVTQAGLVLDGIYALAGKKFNKEDKELLGNPSPNSSREPPRYVIITPSGISNIS